MLASGPDPAMVEKAKELCDDLMINVKEQYDEFKARPPRFSDRGGYHGGDRYRGGHDRHHHDRGHHHHNHSSYSGYAAEPRAAPPTPNTAAQATDTTGHNLADYQAAYAQYYGGNDPYAAYGGFAKYVTLLPKRGGVISCISSTYSCQQSHTDRTPKLCRHVPAVLRPSRDRCPRPTCSPHVCIAAAAAAAASK